VKRLGAVYDWRRELRSHDPDYIRWNQVIFLELLRAGLAYRAERRSTVPGCHTVLANEQVLADGTCERSGDVVERRNLEQWFLRITQYAEELLDALDGLDWPERVKTMQRNWIGRSRARSSAWLFRAGRDRDRGLHHAPGYQLWHDLCRSGTEHPLVAVLVTDGHEDEVAELCARAKQATDIERQSSEARSKSEAPSR